MGSTTTAKAPTERPRGMKFGAALLCAATLTGSTSAPAADGDLDPTFGNGGVTYAPTDAVSAISAAKGVVQTDGKIVQCATYSQGNSIADMVVFRFDADGQPDTAFGTNGEATVDFTGGADNDTCNAIGIQPDGKIIVAGVTGTGDIDMAVARLESDGSLDTTYGNGGRATVGFNFGGGNGDFANALAVQADGKVVLAGFLTTDGPYRFAVARLRDDGSLDPAFNLTGRVTIDFGLPGGSIAEDVAIDAQGRIVVAGVTGAQIVNKDFAIARLLPDGQPDLTFGSGGRTTLAFDLGASGADDAYRVALLRNGRIVLAGSVDTGPESDMAVAQFLADGTPDADFGIAGKVIIPFGAGNSSAAFAIAQEASGKLLIGGSSFEGGSTTWLVAAMARLRTDGSLDTSFGDNGEQTYDLGLTDPPESQWDGLIFAGSHLIASGAVLTSVMPYATAFFIARIQDDSLFGDGFE